MPKASSRFSSIDDFRIRTAGLMAWRRSSEPTIVIPAGTCAQASGANELVRTAKREILAKKLGERIRLRITGCHGFCQMEPSVKIEPEGTFYPKVSVKGMVRIVEAVSAGKVLEDLLFTDPASGVPVEKQARVPFYRKQVRTLLGRNESIDPMRLASYLGAGGYASFVKALSSADPSGVLGEIKASGLRGRGGAGFPTGLKWEMLARGQNGSARILVCNADEGDPGAYMDRSLLEGNPHSIIEGMLIGGIATGSAEGVVYVRNEYPLAIKHLEIALRQAREAGLLGGNILDTGFSFDISTVKGAGAFVCGEETALIHSIEGKMGEPRQRPPFPVRKGIDGRPTVINNVETWANIPVIIEKGAAEYRKVGTENSSGTKIFSLVGKVRYTGLVEIPMGMSLNEIIYDIGGGPAGDAGIKAVQTGGPSGGCLPAAMFDLPVDYDSLAKAGAIMGSGGMIVMDNDTCMVDVAKYFMNFLKDESCGKCFTCRKGTQRMFEILEEIARGEGSKEQLGLLEELATVVKDTTMCGLGQTAPNPVLSMLRHFPDEYAEHVEQGRCAARVCKELIAYTIGEACTGCGACRKACPAAAIVGAPEKMHLIIGEKCIKCGACGSTCKYDAVMVTSGQEIKAA